MKDILEFLANFPGLAPEQWVGLIALAGLLLAAFALYVVLIVVRQGKSK